MTYTLIGGIVVCAISLFVIIIKVFKKLLKKLEKIKLDNATKKIKDLQTSVSDEKEKISFIGNVISAKPKTPESLENFKKLLAEDYQEYANKNDSLAAEAEALLKLQKVENRLEMLSYDKSLLNKMMVAIAGSFSSGKSSFMNSFFTSKDVRLPSGMTQTTAIAAYVMGGDKPSITGYSFKGGRVSISEKMFSLFGHDKREEFNFNMKQIMSHIVFRNKLVVPFEHICFIDTPGFNPGSDSDSDYDAAISSVSQAAALLWCVDVTAGTIKEDEMNILDDIYTQNPNIRIYIIANKVDLRGTEESCSVMDEAETQLDLRGIKVEGMTFYTSGSPYNSQPAEYASYTKGKSLPEFLKEIDVENMQTEAELLRQVEEVFISYITADNERIKRLLKQKKAFEKVQAIFTSETDKKDELIAYYKSRMSKDWKKVKKGNVPDYSDEDASDELFDSMAEIMLDLKTRIASDKKDMEVAKDLCRKMCESVAEVFGHQYSGSIDFAESTEPEAETQAGTQVVEKVYCIKCGREILGNYKFCTSCGTPLALGDGTSSDNKIDVDTVEVATKEKRSRRAKVVSEKSDTVSEKVSTKKTTQSKKSGATKKEFIAFTTKDGKEVSFFAKKANRKK